MKMECGDAWIQQRFSSLMIFYCTRDYFRGEFYDLCMISHCSKRDSCNSGGWSLQFSLQEEVFFFLHNDTPDSLHPLSLHIAIPPETLNDIVWVICDNRISCHIGAFSPSKTTHSARPYVQPSIANPRTRWAVIWLRSIALSSAISQCKPHTHRETRGHTNWAERDITTVSLCVYIQRRGGKTDL